MAETPKKAAPHGATTAATHAPSGAGTFPPFDQSSFGPQLIWLAITFAVLYLMLSKYLLPRIGEVIAERQNTVARDLAKAEALKLDTDKALAAYEKALSEAKGKAGDIAKSTRERLSAETDAEKQKAESELAKSATVAETRIAENKARALASVSEIAGETVSAIVTKLTGGAVSKEDAAKAVAAVRK